MCRLLGIRAETSTSVRHALVSEDNCLRVQSNGHQDGWGIAYYDGAPAPTVVRGLDPAHLDPEFERVSHQVNTRAVIAHVRLASVGAVTLPNAHPFVHEGWVFAHNGTVANFARHRDTLEARIAPDLRATLRGDTDSERCFLLFLTQLRALGRATSLDSVALALGRTMRSIESVADDGATERSSLNFMVTDGERLVATRRGRSLFYMQQGAAPQERRVVVASERLCGSPAWLEVPDDVLVGTDDGRESQVWSLSSLVP